ncbi:MAG: NYN domain-containing protein [Chloroflexi bacterium]|nr:NYN domain-containing protein [Chloroflexota bacterium]
MNEPFYPSDDVALFIDWENFKISLAVGHRTPNVSALKEEVSNHGRVVVAKAYADWVTRSPELRGASQFINDPPALYAAGIEPVYVPTRLSFGNPSATGYHRTTRVKNSVDVKMTADCIEIAHSYPNISTFVLVSGDSDFIHVINTLRTMGKRVIIIGVSWSISHRLADLVDGLILYDVDVDPLTPQENGAEEPAATQDQAAPAPMPRRPAARAASSNGPPNGVDLTTIIQTIEGIVKEVRDAGGTPLLTSIKQRVMRRYPNFDERKVGYSGFKKLMARVAQEGNIKLITAGLVDWAIMADEPDPVDADPVDATPARPGNGHQSTEVPAAFDDQAPDPEDIDTADATPGDAPEFSEEFSTDFTEDEPAEQSPSPSITSATPTAPMTSVDLDALLAETIAGLEELPEVPADGLHGQRITDLIVMADSLEKREDVSHVAFNFLVGEVCQALEQGLAAENEAISVRWGQASSRNYVSKMLRSMGNGNLFVRSWHSSPDEDSGRNKRRRTFYLDHENPLVKQVLLNHWQNTQIGTENDEPPAETVAETDYEDYVQPAMPEGPDEKRESPFLSRLFRPKR